MQHPTATPLRLAFGVEPDRRRFRLRLARYPALAEAVAEHVAGSAPDGRPLDLLEVGPGTGRSLRYLDAKGIASRLRFHGLDVSARRLASVHAGERWRLVRGDAEAGFPFRAACFDVCICEQVIEHLDEPDAVIREIGRVLKPGGLLVLGVPIFPWGVSHARGVSTRLLRRLGVRSSHVQTFDRGKIERMVTKDGRFARVSTRGFRVVSGGVVGFLEDHEWWFRFNGKLGAAFPGACVEVQVVARRTSAP